jgi:hypothetical protein
VSSREAHPPEEPLTNPGDSVGEQDAWLIVARNDRVNRNWEKLIARSPENALRWYKYLRSRPTTRYPGRVFPLRGHVYRGAWECEISAGDRIFYVPDPAARKVIVYYAGAHADPALRP